VPDIVREDGTPVEACVIVCRGLANYLVGDPNSPAAHLHGLYLAAYDPDYQGPEAAPGGGKVEWTSDLDHALTFPDFREAHAEWARTSTVHPVRADGKPHRPLTAFHVEFLTLAAAREQS
jgi:hypothetical protein